MKRPQLPGLEEWIDMKLVEQVDQRRRHDGEIRRNRKLGTTQMIWLFIAVALNTRANSLHEILRLAAADLKSGWSVTPSAFCRARGRFSPAAAAISARPPGFVAFPPPGRQARLLERACSESCRQDDPASSGAACTVPEIRLPQPG